MVTIYLFDPKHSAFFTDAELIRLKMVLKEMGGDIEQVSGIDFNDALKTVLK